MDLRAPDTLTAYAWWWALPQAFYTLSYGQTGEYVLLPLHILLVLWPCRQTMICAHFGFAALRAYRAPFIFNGDWWAGFMDASFGLVMMLGYDLEKAAGVVRGQLEAFYFGASLWKINSSFLSSATSCSTLLIVQLLDAFWPHAPAIVSNTVALTAPYVTILVEFSVGLGLATAPRLGVSLGLLLHLMIALVPPPNNAGGFSVMLAARYFLWMAPEATRSTGLKELAVAVLAAALFVPSANAGNTSYFFDTAVPVYVFQMVILLAALAKNDSLSVSEKVNESTSTTCKALVWAAYFYSFGFVILGIQDMQNTHMFSNLRVHGASNHYFLPTGLLTAKYAGSVVRVDSTNSTWIRDLYPQEVTHLLSDSTKEKLVLSGHEARQFFPLKSRIFGGMSPVENDTVAYTVPAFELRRLLHEARIKFDEPFYIRYAKLDDNLDALQSQSDTFPTVHYSFPGNTCVVSNQDGTVANCEEDEIPFQPPPHPILLKLSLYYPIPLLPKQHEMPCADP